MHEGAYHLFWILMRNQLIFIIIIVLLYYDISLKHLWQQKLKIALSLKVTSS